MNTRWRPTKPLDPSLVELLRHDLAALDRLQDLWTDFAASLDEADRLSLRRRTLRRHAIETGILERLYQIDRGVTETLVAEGLTREAIARAGGELSPGVLPMLEAQLEGLNMVADYVREDHILTTSFVKQLHALITRAQTSYDATDALGRPFQAKLNHGSYKTLPNNVIRADGSLLEFAPPEQVDGEVESLVSLYNGMADVHPIVVRRLVAPPVRADPSISGWQRTGREGTDPLIAGKSPLSPAGGRPGESGHLSRCPGPG